jgi:hypothetical protein
MEILRDEAKISRGNDGEGGGVLLEKSTKDKSKSFDSPPPN